MTKQTSKYLITCRELTGSILFEYKRGILCKLEVSADFSGTEEQLLWLLSKTKLKEESVEKWQQYKDITMSRVLDDLTFEAFYKRYPNKAGKKTMAMNRWKLMSDDERIRAMAYIDELVKQKKEDGTAMPYASTYLNQKYWL